MERAVYSSRRIELILFRVLGLWGRICRMLGVPEDSPAVLIVQRVQQIVMVIRLLHTSAIALEAATGPVGWALAGVGVGSMLLSTGDLIYDVTRGT